ncbi:hypothetical protein CK203_107451 [Vitis vinifera]|uniref:Ubiquitin-like protease family profile domain-containing protein n=1 Tax=Vitis vinifera TaxID=29760 RepID=A0A438EH95_VITVI|nr:hypothetical protein CK203_107451 [Vitis vinifera]
MEFCIPNQEQILRTCLENICMLSLREMFIPLPSWVKTTVSFNRANLFEADVADLIKNVSTARWRPPSPSTGIKDVFTGGWRPPSPSERDGLEVVRNPKRPIGAWIHYYNDQLAMMKENDKGVKINDDVRSNIAMKRRLKKLSGYANENLKIWVIENEIRDCVDGNATIMASENEDDEKFVDGGNLMEMDKTFQQLKTHLIDMAYGASSRSCDQILAKFEENYTTVKGLFLRSSGKPLRMHEEGTKNDMLSCERSLEDTNNMNVNEHYLHTLSNDKLCTEDLNEKNEDACATSIEVHIIPNENQNILPLPIKRSRRDYGKEPLRALCGYPNHVMKTRSSRERKPSKFKVSPFVQKSRKTVKREASESIPMSIREDVVDTQSFNVLQSLVADYVFNKALSKSELLVDFGHEHGVRGDFACLRPRQNLMDVLFIPMHDECPGHWYLCVIDFKNSHIQILDSLRSKNRDKFRFQSVKTVVEFCQTFFKLYDIGKDVFQFSIDWAPSIPTQENGLV